MNMSERQRADIAIVVVAYNRPRSLSRILNSLSAANYPDAEIPLVISIDRGDNQEVLDIANAYQWEYGEKTVLYQEENLGLRAHVLKCGNLTEQYENIIMLEDDLYVSPAFFLYSAEALAFTKDQKNIAGISLYKHMLNVNVREPFEPLQDGYDNWYMQMASSWGQAWTRKQWKDFYTWYEKNKDQPLEADTMPVFISSWPDRSWLKYFNKYIVETNQYFFYPQQSLTTNFADEGANMTECVNDYQVPLLMALDKIYYFSDMEQSLAVYDIFYENQKLLTVLQEFCSGIEKDTLTIDLYGGKPCHTRYLLTSLSLPHRVIASCGRRLRPIDANIIKKVIGNDFFLYDMEKAVKAPQIDPAEKYLYNYKAFRAKYGFSVLWYRIKEKITRRH